MLAWLGRSGGQRIADLGRIRGGSALRAARRALSGVRGTWGGSGRRPEPQL